MRRVSTPWTLAALVTVVVAPLLVAVVAVRRPSWYPVLDHAMAELRLRDAFTSHTPLIGLPGRIGRFPEQGSHPGPLSFYALWPTWKLLGASPWGMQAGVLVLNAIAAGSSVLVAHRRGGVRVAVGVTALLTILLGGYGIETLSEPWNPYIPLLWWVLTLLCVWSVLDGDLPMLPVGVVAASIAAQTHVPYLGLCLGIGALAVIGLVRAWRGRAERTTVLRWGGASVALAVVLWSPVLVDQATGEPGNLSMLWEHFTSPPEEEGEPVGLGEGVELAFRHLDVTSFLSTQGDSLGSLARSSGDAGGSVLPGVVTFAVWVSAAALAWRRRWSILNRLNAVIGAALVLGTYSMSRIFGKVWYYLMLWSWGTAALLVLSVAWTAWHEARRARRHGAGTLDNVRDGVVAALVAVAVISSALLTVRAATVDPPAPQLSAVLAAVVPPIVDALDRDRTYLVTWDDSFYIGSQGMGLVSALDRHGFDVGVVDTWRVPLTHHRVIDPAEADVEVHLAVGRFVERWREVPDAREIAAHDPRSDAERAEYERLRTRVIDDLRDARLDDLVLLVDDNLFGLSIDERLADDTRERVERMLELGSPGAVFLVPVGTVVDGG